MPYDVILDDDWDLPVFCRLQSGIDATAQRVKIALGTIKGEWMLDTSVGIDYASIIQDRPFSEASASAIFKTVIENVSGVNEVQSWVTSFDIPSRTFSATGSVITDDGEVTIEIPPFNGQAGNSAPRVVFIDAITY